MVKSKYLKTDINKIDDFVTMICRWYIPIGVHYATGKRSLSKEMLYGRVQLQYHFTDSVDIVDIGSIDICISSQYDVDIKHDDFILSWHEELGSEMTSEPAKKVALNKVVNFLKVWYYD